MTDQMPRTFDWLVQKVVRTVGITSIERRNLALPPATHRDKDVASFPFNHRYRLW
jgi:hypothetical protein